MATVTAFIKHSHISKAQQAEPYTAAAHARYIMRREATSHVFSERMPVQWHAVQRFLEDHETRLRKNGRVLDKFIISIPHDVSEKDAVETLRRFGNRLGMGRTPFLFSLQGFDTRNHHAHFIFIDRDVETGRRVYGTTERNSSHGIKLEWERVANEAFEQMGYDVRVKVHEGYQQDNDNEQEVAQELEEQAPDVDDLPDMEEFPEEDADDGEEDMATSDLVGVDPAGTIKFLHTQKTELETLNRAQQRVLEATERAAWLSEERKRLEAEAAEYTAESLPTLMANYQAQEKLAAHTRDDGQLKGRALKVFGFTLYRSKQRKEAEVVQQHARELHFEANKVDYTRKSYDQKIHQKAAEVRQAEETAHTHKAALIRVYGDEADMAEVEKRLVDDIRQASTEVRLGDAVTAYAEGEITAEEYRAFLLEAGYDAELKLLDEQLGIEEGGQSL